MNGAAKGSSFERKICVLLSEWWTEGLGLEKRSDVFWRSSQSGGRATQRAKSGKTTAGSYGDIAAIDPIGIPLLKLFTIELKRGRSHGHPENLLDAAPTKKQRPFEACLLQAIEAHRKAGSEGWMLICQRDRKIPMVYVDYQTIKLLGKRQPRMRSLYKMRVNQIDDFPRCISFLGMPLSHFLKWITPQEIRDFQRE